MPDRIRNGTGGLVKYPFYIGVRTAALLQKEGRNMQYTSYELLWLFFIYSVLGWAVGVVIALSLIHI